MDSYWAKDIQELFRLDRRRSFLTFVELEHYVLNELHARLQTRRINYWRDKQGHEVDFVLVRRGQTPLAIECKWSANDFDAKSLKAFAARYPKAQHFVVAHDVDRAYTKHFDSLDVRFSSLNAFIKSGGGIRAG